MQACDATGKVLVNVTPDTNGYLPMSVTQTLTASDTYPSDCDAPTTYSNNIAFSPNHQSNLAYFSGGSTVSGYPGGGANTSVSAGNGVYFSNNAGGYLLSNGGVTETSHAVFSAYYNWVYVGGIPPPAGTPGAAPPAGPISLLVHTNLSAHSYMSPGVSATATVSDSLASSDQVSQTSPTLDTYHLVQAGFSGSNNLAAVSFTGTSTASAINLVPYGYLNGGYPTTTNGFASGSASTYLFAGSRLFTASLQAAATNQNLSTAPLFFYGPSCSVQANAQAIGGTVTEVKILIDGKVIQDVTSGQTTVTASFDALNYPEGYLLPVTMQVWDSAGNHYDSTLLAPVHLPQVQFYDLWTPDYTAAPVSGQVPQAAASTGGVIGGNTTLHLRSQYGALTLKEVRLHLHRDPDATKDTLLPVSALASPAITNFGPPAVYSLWDARCGDPDPSLPTTLPVSQYLNEPWNVGGRNGVYDVTATFTAVGAGGVVHTLTSAATFDREDLLITQTSPVNPTPLLWDPATMQLVPISTTIQAACKMGVTVTMKIYASDQTLVRTVTIPDPTHPVPLIVGGLNGSSVSATPLLFSWDGTKDDGTQAYSGVYMYQFVVSAANGDADTDKSQFLSITTPSSSVQKVSNDGVNAVYNVSYTLNSNDIPAKLASGGVLNVYDPNLVLVGTKGLSDAGVFDADPTHDPNLLKPGPHIVTITIPAPKYAGDYVFLISVKDDDALQDKGGRQRYALQHNERGDYPGAIAWAFGGGSGIEQNMGNGAQYCYDGLHALGYNQMKDYANWYTNPALGDIRGPLESGFFTPGGYFSTGDNHLQVAAIIGHGSLDGRTIYISQTGIFRKYKKYLTTLGSYDNTTQFYNTGKTHYAINSAYLAQEHLLIESINSTNQPISSLRLAYMKMVIVSACDMDYGQGDGIPDVLLTNGVRCVVVLGQHDLPVSAADVFFEGDGNNGRGFFDCLKGDPKNGVPPMTVANAVKTANATVNQKYPGVAAGNTTYLNKNRPMDPGYNDDTSNSDPRKGLTVDFEAKCYGQTNMIVATQ